MSRKIACSQICLHFLPSDPLFKHTPVRVSQPDLPQLQLKLYPSAYQQPHLGVCYVPGTSKPELNSPVQPCSPDTLFTQVKTLSSILSPLLLLYPTSILSACPVGLSLNLSKTQLFPLTFTITTLIHVIIISRSQLAFLLPSLTTALPMPTANTASKVILSRQSEYISFATMCCFYPTCNDVDKSPTYNVAWKTPETKAFLLYDYFHIKYKNR